MFDSMSVYLCKCMVLNKILVGVLVVVGVTVSETVRIFLLPVLGFTVTVTRHVPFFVPLIVVPMTRQIDFEVDATSAVTVAPVGTESPA